MAKALLPSSRAAACDGPKQAMPAARTASATPATSGASGPDDHQIGAELARERGHRLRVRRVDAALLGHGRGPGIARGADQRRHGRIGGQGQAQRVFAGTGTDDEDAHAGEPSERLRTC